MFLPFVANLHPLNSQVERGIAALLSILSIVAKGPPSGLRGPPSYLTALTTRRVSPSVTAMNKLVGVNKLAAKVPLSTQRASIFHEIFHGNSMEIPYTFYARLLENEYLLCARRDPRHATPLLHYDVNFDVHFPGDVHTMCIERVWKFHGISMEYFMEY